MSTRNALANEVERINTNTVMCNALSDAYIAGDFDLVELFKFHPTFNNRATRETLQSFMNVIPGDLSHDESYDYITGDFIARRYINEKVFKLDFANWSFQELKMAIKELLLDDISITAAYRKYTIPRTTFNRYMETIIGRSIWSTLPISKWVKRFKTARYEEKELIFKSIDALEKVSSGPQSFLTMDEKH